MQNIDIALVLDKIRPGAKWRMCGTYQQLVDTWEDKSQKLPSEQEITDAWVRITYKPLDTLKNETWQEVKGKRDALEQAGAPYLNKVLDSDEKSVTRITVAVQAAQAAISAGNTDFALNWTMKDNSVVTMTAAQVCGMAVALAQHSDGLHKIARDLRAKIEAATSAEELATIKWPE